jgi:glycosyltransferase involved in cell wall biosynthesis
LRREVESLARHADLVVCDFLAPSVNVPTSLPARVVLFQHNVEAMIWQRHVSVPQHPLRRAYITEQWRRMLCFERAECRRFASVVAVSDVDAEVFRCEYGVASVTTVATGVDLEYFSTRGSLGRDPREIVFVGSMDWMPNEDGIRWFLGDVLPLLRASLPDARLTIVGRSPSIALRQHAAAVGGVEVTGTVPDVRPYLARAAASVVPLRVGGGTRLKIYEAMAMGTPVVSTTIGAEGLPLEPGRNIAIADEPQTLARALAEMLTDPARAGAMANAALDYIRAHCGWDAVADQFLRNCMEEQQ